MTDMDKESVKNLSDQERIDAIAERVADIITLMGEDVERPGLVKTPVRAAKALYYLTSGYRQDARATIQSALFDNEGSRIVTVKDIEFYSMCEHHILPFFGKISIAYVPGDKIVGLSKLARVVDICARRLQVQERLTKMICDEVMSSLGALGVLVICEAEHMCMKMRGVEKQGASTVTVDYAGVLTEDRDLREQAVRSLSGF